MRRFWTAPLMGLLLLSSATAVEADTTVGEASYYHDKFQGRPTASGEPYNREELTAAHRTLPFGTLLRVTRVDTKQSVLVRINDRGPFKANRIVDLSRKAAQEIDLLRAGIAQVKIEILPADALEDEPPIPTTVFETGELEAGF